MDSDRSSDVDVVLAYYLHENISENAMLKSNNARFLRPSPAFAYARSRSTAIDGVLRPSTAVTCARYIRKARVTSAVRTLLKSEELRTCAMRRLTKTGSTTQVSNVSIHSFRSYRLKPNQLR